MQSVVYHFVANLLFFEKIETIFIDFASTSRYSHCKRYRHQGANSRRWHL